MPASCKGQTALATVWARGVYWTMNKAVLYILATELCEALEAWVPACSSSGIQIQIQIYTCADLWEHEAISIHYLIPACLTHPVWQPGSMA